MLTTGTLTRVVPDDLNPSLLLFEQREMLIVILLFFTLSNAFTREQAWSCAMNVVDTNHDGKIDASEIEATKSKYLYWYERAGGFLVGATSVDAVMKDCDANGDRLIDATDYEAKKLYCMPYKDPKKNWEVDSNALSMVKVFCDRAAGILGKEVY